MRPKRILISLVCFHFGFVLCKKMKHNIMCSFLSCMWDVLLEEIYQGMVDLPGVIRVHVDLHVESNGSARTEGFAMDGWGCIIFTSPKNIPRGPFFEFVRLPP